MSGVLEGGWILDGDDETGASITIRLSDRELADADLGVTLGRHPALSDHVLEDESVSRRHLRLSLREGGLTIEDLNSLNGTLVDGVDLPAFKPAILTDGRVLALGRVRLRLLRIAG